MFPNLSEPNRLGELANHPATGLVSKAISTTIRPSIQPTVESRCRCGGMADAMDSKSIDRKVVKVQVLSPVLFEAHENLGFRGLFSFAKRCESNWDKIQGFDWAILPI